MKTLFDRYYKRYDAWYEQNKFAYLSELAAVKKVLPKAGRGLEIGVGTGRFAAPLGISMGIDASGAMIELARERGVRGRWGLAEDLPFLADTFDYVVIIITLCFVQNPLQVLKESSRVLKKSGRIIIGIIDKNSFLGKFYRKKKSIFYSQASFFSVRQVERLLKQTGFCKLSYHQTLYRLPGELNSIQKPRTGFGQGGFVLICAQKVK